MPTQPQPQPQLYSASQAAALISTSTRSAARIAARLNLGTRQNRNLVLLTAAEVETMRGHVRAGPGNPNFVAGSEHQKTAAKKSRKVKEKRVTKKSAD